MSEQLWVVRAGREAKFAGEFVDGSYIAIAFREFASDDLSLINEDMVKMRAHTPTDRSHARQLIAFAYTMEVGDLIIVPRLTTTHRDYLLARINGPYRHVVQVVIAGVKGSGNHQRPVEWLGAFTQDSLDESVARSLGSISTLFRPRSAESELRGVIASLASLEQ